MIQLRRFNEEGIRRFRDALHTIREGGTADVEGLLWDEELTVQISDEPVLEVRSFANRFDAGKYLHEVLSGLEEELVQIDRDVGLWAWLAAIHFDGIKATFGRGKWPGADARWIPEVDDWQKYYRHLLAGPYQIYRAHQTEPERAMVVLATPVGSPGEAAEQLSARQEIVTNGNFLKAASRLYFDDDSSSLRRGHGGKGGGSVRRLAKDIYEQFDLTWDFYGMEAEDILDLLPAEFDRFRPDEASADAAD